MSSNNIDSSGHQVTTNGSNYWYNQNGEFHRDDDLPAIIYTNGTKKWYQDGHLHRENDLPAVIRADGTKIWYIDGKCHRDGGNYSYIDINGNKYWYINGKLHRTDGPAVEWVNGYKAWFIDGEEYTFKQWLPHCNLSYEEQCELALITNIITN